jgi:heat shock protein HtpX
MDGLGFALDRGILMKRIFLLIASNFAIMLVLSLVVSLTGANQFLAANGLNLGKLLVFSAILGFGGSFISLGLSKIIAKFSTGARVIHQPNNADEVWLMTTVASLAQKANIAMPEVAIYDGEPNAFATGPSRDNSLVAVSTGLLHTLSRDEVEAVLAHEVAHVANGDMVTLTLIQGVMNTFVYFLARVVGYVVDSLLRRNNEEQSGTGLGYTVTVLLCDIVFGILASLVVMYFSRQREYRADAGASELLGSSRAMIGALQRLGGREAGVLPNHVATAGIQGRPGWLALFASHPSLEDRIAALSSRLV